MNRLLSIVAVTAAVLAAVAPAATAAPDPQELTLRLPDLGPSYELGSSRCDERRSRSEKRWWPSSLPSLSKRFPHRGCVIAFAESWTRPGAPPLPDYVMSAAFVFADAAGPAAALRKPRSVAARILDADRRALAPLAVSATIGDELRALRLDGHPKSGTVLLWRSGPVLALTLAAGKATPRATRAARRLASIQQARIASPMLLLPADLDDVEVPLDNPRLGVPVWWLGRDLPAQGNLPPMRLLAVDGSDRTSSQWEPRAAMQYGTGGLTDYVDLELWKPRQIRRGLRAPQWRLFCQRRIDADIEGVDATIIGLVLPAPRRCAGLRPTDWTAVAFFRGVAVDIQASACSQCKRRGVYATPAGLRAIIRALRPRAPLGAAPAPPAG